MWIVLRELNKVVCQTDVLDWFVNQRLNGNHDFFSRTYVLKCLKKQGFRINSNSRTKILLLHNHDFLDVWKPSDYKLRFRAKDNLINGYIMEA